MKEKTKEKKAKTTNKKTSVKKPIEKAKPTKTAKVEKVAKTVKSVKEEKKTLNVDDGKQTIIDKFSTHSGDTGSPEVQVAILTWKIINLQKHLGINQKDNHSRRGLLKIVSKRRRIMKYLKDKDEGRFLTLESKIKEYQTESK